MKQSPATVAPANRRHPSPPRRNPPLRAQWRRQHHPLLWHPYPHNLWPSDPSDASRNCSLPSSLPRAPRKGERSSRRWRCPRSSGKRTSRRRRMAAVNLNSLLSSRRTGAAADIWKRLSFYSASGIARIKRLRRTRITSGVEGDK